MFQIIAISTVILLICMAFLAIKVIFLTNGEFPRGHVSDSKELRKRGVHCAQTQDWQERHRKGLYGDKNRPEVDNEDN